MYFLENEKIGLRHLSVNDIKGGYGAWLNSSEVCKYNSHHKYPVYEEDLRDFVESVKGDRSSIVLAVDEKTSHIHIGNISLQEIDFISRQAEIAFLFGETSYWGKGYATMAAALIISHAFKELGMNRIYFGTAENNIGMQKVGEKLGFRKSGVRRQALYKNGNFWDIYDYDMLVDEWKVHNVK